MELEVLSELIAAPVVTTASGKGAFPEDHPLAGGVFGTFGLPAANALVSEADALLVVGSKLAPTDTARENPKLIDPSAPDPHPDRHRAQERRLDVSL